MKNGMEDGWTDCITHKAHCINGFIHHENGPAIIWHDSLYVEFWYNGKYLSWIKNQKEFDTWRTFKTFI